MFMKNDYNGSLTREKFLFYEMRITAALLSDGLEKDEVIRRICEDNLFQFPTERMMKNIANTCLRRIEALGSDALREILAHSSVDVAKQINLYAMMRDNRVVRDFMITVIGEKFRTHEFDFSRKDLNLFFFRLCEQNDQVASWSEKTVNKIKQVLTKVLAECGYLDSVKSCVLNPVAISPELEDEIRILCDTSALCAFNCFR